MLFLVAKIVMAIFVIAIVSLLLYLMYILVYVGYPRPMWIGNSAPLEEYMSKTFFPELVKHCKQTKQGGGYLGYCAQLPELKEYPIQKHHKLYFPLIFWDALDDIPGNKKELSLIKQFVKEGDPKDVEKYFAKGSAADINPSAFSGFKIDKDDIKSQFKRITGVAAGYKNSQEYDQTGMSWMIMDMMLNEYLPQIIPMYNMRKSGGVANFMIFKLYFADYTKYVFTETIPDIWKDFTPMMHLLYNTIVGVIKSKKVSKFFSNLPMTLAGVQTFEDRKEVKEVIEKFNYADDGDQVETFIGALINIAKTFVKMFKLITVLVTFVLNPLRFIQILIGFVVGLFVFLIYQVLVALSPIFYIPAFCYTLSLKMGMTFVWLAIFFMNFLIYLVLWILDFATGGAVLQMLRCENLPSAWHTYAGFSRNNIYKRQIFCSSRCGANFTPKGLICARNPKYQPPFCPQQVIFSAYMGDSSELDRGNLIHKYKPDIQFYRNNDEWKEQEVKKSYRNRVDFIASCNKSMKNYDHLSKAACRYFQNATGPGSLKAVEPDKYNAVMDLCYEAYCDFNKDTSFKMCDNYGLESNKRKATYKKDEQDIITSVVFACIVLVIMCLIFAALFKTVTYKESQ